MGLLNITLNSEKEKEERNVASTLGMELRAFIVALITPINTNIIKMKFHIYKHSDLYSIVM